LGDNEGWGALVLFSCTLTPLRNLNGTRRHSRSTGVCRPDPAQMRNGVSVQENNTNAPQPSLSPNPPNS